LRFYTITELRAFRLLRSLFEKFGKNVTSCNFAGLSYSLLNFVAKNCEKQMHRAKVIAVRIIKLNLNGRNRIMKKHRILLVMLALSLALGVALARDRRGERPSGPPRSSNGGNCMDQIGLTQEQLDAIEAIREAAMDAIREAESPTQARDIIAQLRLDLLAVFTEEQLAALEECRQQKRNRYRDGNCMAQLDLTDEQIAEMDAIRQAAMDAIREADCPVNASDIFEQMQQAIEEVLTPEQLAAYRECIRPRLRLNCMENIGLTEEQIAAMSALREAAIAALEEAQGQEEVRAILDQLYEDMMSLLTDEQLAALQECRDGQRRGENTE
jgi:Spy/CpxP family protein refolding chaperone